jgi:hypothetical protein
MHSHGGNAIVQLENFAGCTVVTGQEAPENGRRIREDLYKKMMSADGLLVLSMVVVCGHADMMPARPSVPP